MDLTSVHNPVMRLVLPTVRLICSLNVLHPHNVAAVTFHLVCGQCSSNATVMCSPHNTVPRLPQPSLTLVTKIYLLNRSHWLRPDMIEPNRST